MISRKLKFENGSWVVLIQSGDRVCEVYSNGLTQFTQDNRTMSEIAEDLVKRLTTARGEVIKVETNNAKQG